MILKVNPNRMELLKLRKRLVLAKRGHKLLQDKLEQLLQKFFTLSKQIDKEVEKFVQLNKEIFTYFMHVRFFTDKETLKKSLLKIDVKLKILETTERIMNVKVPNFTLEQLDIKKNYDFFTTSAQLDVAIEKANIYISSLLKVAQLLKTFEILAYEIEKTRRRVNALEYLLIPSIEQTIRFITQKLNELEMSNSVRLLRIKEIVRSH